MRWERAPGVVLEPLGDAWAAYSALSGETLLIGNESAAVLEVLAERACTETELCAVLAQDSGLPPAQIAALLDEAQPALVAAGLVRVA